MAVYEFNDRPHFLPLQVTTTRNVNDNVFVGWFMGGLHYQVEHHLFPYIPRHNLGKVCDGLMRSLGDGAMGRWDGASFA